MKRRSFDALLCGAAVLCAAAPARAAAQGDCAPAAPECPAARPAPAPSTPGADTVAASPAATGGDSAAASRKDLTRLTPVVSLATQSQWWRDVSQGASTLSYSTPAYVSRDVPRSLSLFYTSGQAAPMGAVDLQVTDNSTDTPVTMSIRVRDPWGAWVTNEIFYAAGNGVTRLAATWDASPYGTGTYWFPVMVRSYWSDGTYTEAPAVNVGVVIVNERNSHAGIGWSLPGWETLIGQTFNGPDGVTIVNGDGSAGFFRRVCSPSCSFVSPPGDWSSLAQYSDGYIRTYPDGAITAYTLAGRISYRKDRFGNETDYQWGLLSDGTYAPSKITDPAGKWFTLTYTTPGKLSSVQDSLGRVNNVAINTAGELTNVQTPALGSDAIVAQYDTQHRLTQYWDRASALTSFYYDVNGLVYAQQLAPVRLAGQTTDTRPIWYFTQQLSRILPASGKGTQASPGDRRQPADVFASITDPRGKVRWMVTDRFGQPMQDINPFGWSTTLERNDSGQVTHVTSPSGHSVRYTWSGVELAKVQDETTNDSTVYDYEHTYHQPTRVRHYAGTALTYDASSYYNPTTLTLDSSRVAGKPKTVYGVRTDGRLSSVTDGEGHGTYYWFLPDAAWGNLASVGTGTASTSYRRTVQYVYDKYGRDSLTISPNSDTTQVAYDVLNQTVSVTDPLHHSTAYGYDYTGLHTVTDANSQVYTYNRNVLGWVTSEVDPRTKSIAYAYDASGNVASVTNRRGQAVSFTYDDMNRPLTRTADGAQSTWTYDVGERWMSAANGESTDTVQYDVAGRISSAVTVRSGVRYAVASGYDGSGNRNLVSATGPWTGTKTVGYHYDAAMQLDTLTDFAGGKTPFTYNGDGQEITRTLPNGLNITHDYPSTHIASEISYLGTLDPKVSVGYQQDSRGLVTARMNSARDTVTSYGYDRLARLTSISFDHVINSTSTTCSGGALQSPDGGVCAPAGGIKDNVWLDSFTWDAVGNPTNHGATVVTGNRLTQMNGFRLEYDDDGNLTHKYKTGFDEVLTWNSLGQLTQVVVNGTTVTYGYDAYGRRARRTKGTAYTQYLWDGDDVLFERDQAGTLSEYTNYPDIDSPHSLKRGSSVWYYASDNVGSITGLISSPTTLANQYQYDPFGQPVFTQETVANTRRFQGRELDSDAGLYYFRARWYDPELNRFVSEDPIGLDGGMNMYSFANNNAVNFVDPSGLCIELKNGHKATKEQLALVKLGLDSFCTDLEGVKVTVGGNSPAHCRTPGFCGGIPGPPAPPHNGVCSIPGTHCEWATPSQAKRAKQIVLGWKENNIICRQMAEAANATIDAGRLVVYNPKVINGEHDDGEAYAGEIRWSNHFDPNTLGHEALHLVMFPQQGPVAEPYLGRVPWGHDTGEWNTSLLGADFYDWVNQCTATYYRP